MSGNQDWESVTKIGSKTGGGGGPRESVVRGRTAINAAQRSGTVVGTEKKYATGNAVSSSRPPVVPLEREIPQKNMKPQMLTTVLLSPDRPTKAALKASA
jgi:multiprotein bridging factor 1